MMTPKNLRISIMATTARPFYDSLFSERVRELILDDPRHTSMPGVLNDLDDHGFFGFLLHSRYAGHSWVGSALSDGLRVLCDTNPAVATEVIETQLHVIGLRRAAKLVAHFNIQYSTENMLAALSPWVARLEHVRATGTLLEANMLTAEFNTEFFYNSVMLRLYPDLIFSARSQDEKALIKRLFVASPASFVDREALRYHKRFNQENFDLLTHEGDYAARIGISYRAVFMALQGQLDGQKLAESEVPTDPQCAGNIELARLCAMDGQDIPLAGFSECLSHATPLNETGCALVHGILQERLNATPVEQRTEALSIQLRGLITALESRTGSIGVNVAVGLLRVAVDYANLDARPLLAILKYCNTLPALPNTPPTAPIESTVTQNREFCTKLKKALFNTPPTLEAAEIVGTFGEPALTRLLASGVAILAADHSVVFRSPNLHLHGPKIKKAIADFAIKCLKQDFGLASSDTRVSNREAQAMVDADLFNIQHWKAISADATAVANITKAHLPVDVLEMVGDQVREMALGTDLGL
jgi:hypothetical protein